MPEPTNVNPPENSFDWSPPLPPGDRLTPHEGLRDDTARAAVIELCRRLAPAEREDEIGRVGQYRLLKVLGHGGMGCVMLAEDIQLERRAAVKFMLPKLARREQARDRFLREARHTARLKHDNIVTIHAVSEHDGIPYFVMEFLEGQSLETILARRRDLPLRHVLRIAREVAQGLHAAHALGLIHRDIKPANIWLETPRGRVKVLDFGLARMAQEDLRLTYSGALIGTPRYMSPEQAVSGTVDPRSDLFSLGIVLYELCTGELPFRGDNIAALAVELNTKAPAPARQLNPQVPAALGTLIERLLARQPDQRIQSAQEVTEELHAIEAALKQSFHDEDELSVSSTVIESLVPTPTAIQTAQSPIAPTVWQRPVSPAARRVASRHGPRRVDVALGLLALLLLGFFVLLGLIGTSSEDNRMGRPGGEEIELEFGNGLKMTFCWVPAGKATLGSPIAEMNRGTNENEREFTSQGFWLAKYPVTQRQWQALMGSNPSRFTRDHPKIQAAHIADTGEFPVDNVSWQDCQTFLSRLNERARAPEGMGTGKFALPQEDQWEYACRGGKGNKQAFYFGTELNGTQANCNGTNPYGTAAKGENLERTTKVGAYEQMAPHPWRLCDMHGNVWQWCENWYDSEQKAHVVRGGSWYLDAKFCRSAYRGACQSDFRCDYFGCRVCFRGD